MSYLKSYYLLAIGRGLFYFSFWTFFCAVGVGEDTVYVSRFWHNHQPIYWPEWNGASQPDRVQFAQDSILLKSGQLYDSGTAHPENDLSAIFGVGDRVNSYQGGPRNSLSNVNSGGYAMSYSGSLMNNVASLGAASSLGYGLGWWNGNREARNWTTSGGSRKLDLVGFTYHHSLGAVLPKEVFRKEIQIFKEAYYKAWNTGSASNHSKGFFPTEMAFSSPMIDVLSDEGYEWVIVASHHLSRTLPGYMGNATYTSPEANSWKIFSSPPNPADQLGSVSGGAWWFGTGNVGETAWNHAPYAYQLHKAKYVNPETGAVKTLVMVPSDDIQSYKAGYSGWQKGLVDSNVAPYANDASRPCLVMPATDGDNAWGGGSSSWDGDAPSMMNNGTYPGVAIQDFVNQYGGAADIVHIEDGAWIFPESDYGSPNFLKWVEPPVAHSTATNRVYNTQIDIETPGFASKFYSWAPVIAGANWCQTAEQMIIREGGSVQAWKIQDPYDNLNSRTYSSPNLAERAWHIYLTGLDSGFNYYGGLGNDDEIKTSLATRRAYELLATYVNDRKATIDDTPPTVFKPQRFPYNPGGYTFGWINSIPGGNSSALKKMNSEFYVWTHAYDVSGITSIVLKIRKDNDGVNSMASHVNEVYDPAAVGLNASEVGSWISIPMTKRILPSTASALTAAANNSQIQYFSQAVSPVVADYYFAKITDANVPTFRGKLLDYYIEATDARGNISKSDIQHVFVVDDGAVLVPPAAPTVLTATAASSAQINLTWSASSGATSYTILRNGAVVGTTSTLAYADTGLLAQTTYTYTIQAANAYGDSTASPSAVATTPPTPSRPAAPTGLTATVTASSISLSWGAVSGATDYVVRRGGLVLSTSTATSFTESALSSSTVYTYTVSARNSAGESATTLVSGTTLTAPVAFAMNGTADFAKYLVSNPGMTIYAAVRGNLLYVATWNPGIAGNDHFILVTDQLLSSATAPAPWGKAGSTSEKGSTNVRYFLAAESGSSAYISWFRWPSGGSASAVSGTGYASARGTTDGTQMEGTIDLVQAFGSLPATLYVAALAYQTADYSSSVVNSGVLVAQAPATVGTVDNKVDPAEFLALPAASIRDSLANGTYDLLDPNRGFVVNRTEMISGGFRITWAVVPGQKYQVDYLDDLGTGTWVSLGAEVQANSGQAEIMVEDSSVGLPDRRFYRIRLVP